MPRRTLHRALPLIAVILASCAGDGTPFEPLPDGLPLPVTLTTTTSSASGSTERLDVVAAPGGAELTWNLVSSGCLVAEGSALQSGNVVEVRVHRSGNPLVGCVAIALEYRHVVRVWTPAPGHYDVRLVDDMLGQPLRPVGRAIVSVPPTL